MVVIVLLGKSWQNAYGIMEMLVGSGVPILNKGRISSFSNARPTKKNWAHGKAKIQGRENSAPARNDMICRENLELIRHWSGEGRPQNKEETGVELREAGSCRPRLW